MTQVKQAVSQQTTVELPRFEQVIKLEIEAQAIFEKLMSEFPPEYKHKEILAHAIVGVCMENNCILPVFNALNGYPNTLNFNVGDKVYCISTDKRVADGDGYKNVEIGECEVVAINPYTKWRKLTVKYWHANEWKTAEVDHKDCTKWAEYMKASYKPVVVA